MTITLYSPEDLRVIGNDKERLNLLDVRTSAEFEAAYIEGSHNLPLDQLQKDPSAVAALLPEDVVLVCQSGARAGQAADALAAAGAPHVSVLAGGIIAYQQCGGKVLGGQKRWAMERQVRMVAGTLVLGGLVGARFVHPRMAYLSAGVGGGLMFAAASNTCVMASALSKMPWNKAKADLNLEAFFRNSPVAKPTD
ncbi:rhodanese-like domain-containing protein [Nesterenkonia haasae]|uniref:rhodanese-like domain-containing protein n=1 Tax=Nesterenkonia haasae TaxID=2587813 RepID=UPI001390A366|nr:rhodanese-like domain-containing protein [Nesterenkonia haasae]NDK30274.1 rhodanese-like domain-containing protein [Nesterenkonia haasae]